MMKIPHVFRDGDGFGDERLMSVHLFTAGAVREAFPSAFGSELNDNVLRLHDHEGVLTVFTDGPIPKRMKEIFREAWEVVGEESKENVEFVDVWESFRRYFPRDAESYRE